MKNAPIAAAGAIRQHLDIRDIRQSLSIGIDSDILNHVIKNPEAAGFLLESPSPLTIMSTQQPPFDLPDVELGPEVETVDSVVQAVLSIF